MRIVSSVQRKCILFRSASFAISRDLAVVRIWVVWLMLVPFNAADADVRAAQQAQQKLAGGPQSKKGTRKI